MSSFKIRSACIEDTALILQMIRELADFEQLVDQVVADEATLRQSLLSFSFTTFLLFLEGRGSISKICMCAQLIEGKDMEN